MATCRIQRLCRRRRQCVLGALRTLLLGVGLLMSSVVTTSAACEQQGVMYQPLNRDSELGAYGWHYLFQQLRNDGIDFGVLQWTQYGDEDFSAGQPWLRDSITVWQNYMPLWLGLHLEDDYFSEMSKGLAAQQTFFTTYLRKVNGAVARWEGWRQQHKAQFLGWYIPLELSDAYFDTPAKRQQLATFLTQLRERIGTTPLAISVFMSATLPAAEFGAWLEDIQQLGYHVWLQDGVGTQALSAAQRADYFAALNCDVVMINEAFVQTSKQPFAARSASAEELAAATSTSCHRRIWFSLRYLPQAVGLLYLSDVTRQLPAP